MHLVTFFLFVLILISKNIKPLSALQYFSNILGAVYPTLEATQFKGHASKSQHSDHIIEEKILPLEEAEEFLQPGKQGLFL